MSSLTTPGISLLAASAVILLAVAYRDAIQDYSKLLYQAAVPAKGRRELSATKEASDPGGKTVSQSSVSVMYRITQDMTDEYGRLFAGEMLKIIDIVAGVASRRHSEMSCVTISLDRFILVQEIRAGDTIHVYGSVNRAWGSSLETGIKVTREDPLTGKAQYCCHAYLTFVALAPSPKPNGGPSPSIKVGGEKSGPRPPRPKLKRIIPVTLIEKKRYLLAGRRRELRLNGPHPYEGYEIVREEVLKLEVAVGNETAADSTEGSGDQQREIFSLEKELLADALSTNDPSVIKFEGQDGQTLVSIRSDVHGGLEAPVVPLNELHEVLSGRKRGRRGTWIDGASSVTGSPPSPSQDIRRSSSIWLNRRNQLESPTITLSTLQESTISNFEEVAPPKHSVALQSTFACTMHIVMPQHANSNGVLFGGQLM
ncbi:Acyl-coenzyme A thioesterase 12, partial [Tulasnella sp. 418]